METKAEVQEAKAVFSETRFFPHSTFSPSEKVFCAFKIQYAFPILAQKSLFLSNLTGEKSL